MDDCGVQFSSGCGTGLFRRKCGGRIFPGKQGNPGTDESSADEKVSVGGMPAGIYMETDGVLILDTQQIKGIDGKMYEPAQGMVKSGDYIKAVNQKEICGKKNC